MLFESGASAVVQLENVSQRSTNRSIRRCEPEPCCPTRIAETLLCYWTSCSADRKAKDRHAVVALARLEFRGGKLWLVWRVGKVLRLET